MEFAILLLTVVFCSVLSVIFSVLYCLKTVNFVASKIVGEANSAINNIYKTLDSLSGKIAKMEEE